MEPKLSYLLCATPRSGSYLLCEALTNTGLAGRPTEFFALGQEKTLLDYWQLTMNEYDQYLSKVFSLGTTPNGVFGAKIHWFTFEWCLAKFRTIPGCAQMEEEKVLATLFPGLHYISITRRDKLRQAISYVRALQTDAWIRIKGKPEMKAPPGTFDRAAINRSLQVVAQQEQAMQRYFTEHGIQPFPVVYEELVTSYEETAKNILHYLGIPFSKPLTFGERHMVKQADEITEEWIERYQASRFHR